MPTSCRRTSRCTQGGALLKQLVVQTLFLALLLGGFWVIRNRGPAASTPRGAGPRAKGKMSFGTPRVSARARTEACVPVVATLVVRKPVDEFILSTCTLEARKEVEVVARISDRITELLVEEGDRVKAGQTLAKLDQEEHRLTERECQVRLANAKITCDRMERMFKDNVVSQEQYDDARLSYETAHVQSEQAKLTLSYTDIQSPIDGVVVARHVDVGQHVTANEALFTIANYNPIWGRIHVPERDLAKIKLGLAVKVRVECVPDHDFVGRVSLISPVVDPDSGTVKVTFEIPDPDRYGLRPGMYASTRLITATRPDALVLPKKALIVESDTNEVFVVKDFLAAQAPADYAKMLKTGDKVVVVAKAKGSEESITIDSTCHNVAAPDEGDATVECLLTLPDGHKLTDDMTVALKFETRAGKGNNPRTVTVRVDKPSIRRLALKRPVKVGFSQGDEIEILSGVEPGERVVTVGNEDLKQGSIVTIIGADSQGAVQVAKPGRAKASQPTHRMAALRQRLLSSPKVKAEYEKRLKADPSLATDRAKFRQFAHEMYKRGLVKRRGR